MDVGPALDHPPRPHPGLAQALVAPKRLRQHRGKVVRLAVLDVSEGDRLRGDAADGQVPEQPRHVALHMLGRQLLVQRLPAVLHRRQHVASRHPDLGQVHRPRQQRAHVVPAGVADAVPGRLALREQMADPDRSGDDVAGVAAGELAEGADRRSQVVPPRRRDVREDVQPVEHRLQGRGVGAGERVAGFSLGVVHGKLLPRYAS